MPGGLPSSGLAVTVLEPALGLSPERCPSVAFGAVLWGAPSVVRFVVRVCFRFRRPILRPISRPILFRPDHWAPQHGKIGSGIGPRTRTVADPLPDTESGMKSDTNSDIKSDIKSDRAPWTDRAPDGVCISAEASGTRSAAHAGSAQFSGQGPGKIGRPPSGEPMRARNRAAGAGGGRRRQAAADSGKPAQGRRAAGQPAGWRAGTAAAAEENSMCPSSSIQRAGSFKPHALGQRAKACPRLVPRLVQDLFQDLSQDLSTTCPVFSTTRGFLIH